MRAPYLSAAQIAKLQPRRSPYRVYPNLYFHHPTPNAGSWLYRSAGEPKWLGLGSTQHVPYTEARLRADELRVARFRGRFVAEIESTRKPKEHTFAHCCDAYVEAHEGSWSKEHRRLWLHAMRDYAYPHVKAKSVDQISLDDILTVLQPHWATRTASMVKLRVNIAAVLEYATMRGWRSGTNPARWRGCLDKLLPDPAKTSPPKHHPALAWRALPGVYAKLKADPSSASQACCLALLTACRRAEAAAAVWTEFDLVDLFWTLPAGRRTKTGKSHTIPLSGEAMTLLANAATLRRGDHVFPGQTIGKPVNGGTLLRTFTMVAPNATLHGTARSAFRDWAASQGIPKEWSEAALAHATGKIERAYARDDLRYERQEVMERWARHLAGA